MKIIFKSLIIGLLILSVACSRDDDSSCDDNTYLGEFSPTDKAMSALPYQENEIVVFTDSLGNQIDFRVSGKEYSLLQWIVPGYCPTNYYYPVDFHHDGGQWMVRLENDSSDFQLDVQVLSVQEFYTHKIYDDLAVTYQTDGYGHQCLNLPVDQRTLRDLEYEDILYGIEVEESMTFFGKTFNNVYHRGYFADTSFNKTYYNYEVGIVAIRDEHGRRWVFDSVR